MRKSSLIATALVIAAVAVAVVVFLFRGGHGDPAPQTAASAAAHLTVSIDNQTFTLVDGAAEQPAAPGAATRNTLRVVGDPVSGDVSGDGKPDAALLLRNDPGGSGIFYYAVVAVDNGGTWTATNALPLGDRINPEGIDYTGGRFVYRFQTRGPGEPMANTPTVEKVVPIRYNSNSGQISEAL